MRSDSLVLASASPRRRELLARIHPEFIVDPCPYPEPLRRSDRTPPGSWAQALAYFKARAVADRHPERWVLGADTIVACDGQILGKPIDLDDARRMLTLQAGRPSDVITGICLVRRGAHRQRLTHVEVTQVWMRDDVAVREAYLDTGDWEGKAGAYGIQDVGDRLVTRIAGSFSNVVGLPLERTATTLRAAGLSVVAGVVEPPWSPAQDALPDVASHEGSA